MPGGSPAKHRRSRDDLGEKAGRRRPNKRASRERERRKSRMATRDDAQQSKEGDATENGAGRFRLSRAHAVADVPTNVHLLPSDAPAEALRRRSAPARPKTSERNRGW